MDAARICAFGRWLRQLDLCAAAAVTATTRNALEARTAYPSRLPAADCGRRASGCRRIRWSAGAADGTIEDLDSPIATEVMAMRILILGAWLLLLPIAFA